MTIANNSNGRNLPPSHGQRAPRGKCGWSPERGLNSLLCRILVQVHTGARMYPLHGQQALIALSSLHCTTAYIFIER